MEVGTLQGHRVLMVCIYVLSGQSFHHTFFILATSRSHPPSLFLAFLSLSAINTFFVVLLSVEGELNFVFQLEIVMRHSIPQTIISQN